jgi:hypothetical protein
MRLVRLAGLLLMAMLVLVTPVMASPDATPQPQEVTTGTSIEFPQGMSFTASIPLPSPDADVDAVQLLYRIGSDPTLNLEILSPSEYAISGQSLEITGFVDLQSAFVPFGVDLTFTWEILLADGSVVTTVDESTQWMDTRFEWDVRTSEQIRLYTYDTNDAFADMMVAESQAAVDELESRYQLEAIPPLSIWVYPGFDDFAGTMQGNSREAIAGVTYPGLDTIVAVVPNGDDAEFGRVIPHEISHQVLFAATDNPYAAPPLWFDEGIATHTQIGGTGHYAEMVFNANADGTLYDIRSLEASFPYQPQQATLAYASSWSMISYIEATWGPEGIALLIDAFRDGLSPDDAVERALGIPVDELDPGWRAWIAVNGAVTGIAA